MIATALSDAELLAQARRGDEAAFTELYVRHQAAARRLASSYGRAGDPDDLVNESFERVLAAIKHGAGPDEAFRAYLFVTLRRLAADRIARLHDEPVEEVPEPIRSEQHGEPLDPGERELVLAAYESLPERWQAVLWQTAVEGRQPRDLAPTFGMSANAAAALAYRAREKLRQAYLQAHLLKVPHPECEPHRSRLGAYVRDGLGRRDRSATETHLTDCAACSGLVAELRDIDRMLVRSIQPFFVVTATQLAAATAGAGGGAVVGTLAGKAWSKARSNPGPTAAGAAAVAAVAAAVALGLIVSRGDDDLIPSTEAPTEQAAPRDADPAAPAPPEPPAPATPGATQDVASRHPVQPPTVPPPTTAAAPPTTGEPPATTAPTTEATAPPTTSPTTTTPPPTNPPPTTPPPTQPPPTTPPPSQGPLLLDVEVNLNLLGIQLGLDLEI